MRNSQLRVVVLSGPICAGKSNLATLLSERYDAQVISTRDLIIKEKPKVTQSRQGLQRAGNSLDKERGAQWVADALSAIVTDSQTRSSSHGIFVVDSVRNKDQLTVIRQAYGADVHHIHLLANESELEKRFAERDEEGDLEAEYRKIKQEKNEKNIGSLADVADIVVPTDQCSPDAVLVRATALLNLYSRRSTRLVDVIVGGQYGSEGKGNIVGHIAPEYDLLVRVGGPNAGHKVYADPAPDAFFHLPSGTTRARNAKLLLGAGAVIYPRKLLEEISQHEVDKDRLRIDPQAMIIEEYDREDESKALGAISSTAQGVGFSSARKITGRALYKEQHENGAKSEDGREHRLAKDVPELKPYIEDSQEILDRYYSDGRKILLEGTQGTSLSMHHGMYPHVTSRDTTVAGCLADAGIAPTNVEKVIMVCRTYPIRVGGPSGPMGINITYEQLAERSGIPIEELLETETTTTTKKQRRIAEFDWAQFRKAVQLNGPTDIALTFVDYLNIKNREAYRVEQLTEETLRFIEEIERVSGRQVSMISTAFDWRNVIDRRNW